VVVQAIGDARDVVVVAQSFGGYVAPIVADRLSTVRLLVLVAGMIPRPGESAEAMFDSTGWRPSPEAGGDALETFYHDVPPKLAREALAHGRSQSPTAGSEPWPLERWPGVPVRFVLCQRDRFFPAAWLRGVVRDRLGVAPDELDSGHCPALSKPRELADLLDREAIEVIGG
jgi:pimeloyl-ACP methyl ester carboxylesterase